MRNFLFGHPLGSPAYLCPIAPFRPDIAREFHRHLSEGRADQARDIVFRYEEPLLAFAATVNWLMLMKTAIGLLGFYHAPTLGSPREASLGPEESARVRTFLTTTFGLGRSGTA